MGGTNDVVETAVELWPTPQVVEFLKISRQAINRRLKNRRMLGYSGPQVTLFPTWQFDLDHHEVREEVAELLDVVDAEVGSRALAEWMTTAAEGGRTPATMLFDPATKDVVLAMASALTPGTAAASDGPKGKGGKPVPAWVPPPKGEDSGAQHAILLAAADLFARKGPAKVSLREVAAAADVSYGLIHRFYRTKENLLMSVMEMLVTYGGDRLSEEDDAYAALENSFGADVDSGQFGRMLTWSVFEGTPPDRLLNGVKSRGYRNQIEALWNGEDRKPDVRAEFDSDVLASLLALVGAVWNLYEPYLTELADSPDRTASDIRREVTEMLQVLVYATRPNR
ncbi:TetR/AcrR family transcriptional regulator [Gordonia sp. HY002]|uniref:TetR/AcrR family transcriptional regulator n=1 Tax=Gordonia zhenghanii TaxID=2911516 RepID=UPI001EF09F63|nr:helix-turn-helix domain-containing protein [Gordonia zhenghanii]MCF8568784.1 TetR/AcrR family transcriptional regulator [Gordonia zhenghanii]MCF8606117.1 TetR/AcrR family transcriptional regulator [Gordonia zhenghanii]